MQGHYSIGQRKSIPNPFARYVRELKWQVGRYITCNEQEIQGGLGDALLEDDGDETPPVDSPAAMDDEDAWLTPVQTPPVENPMRPTDEGEGEKQMYPSWIRVHSALKVATMKGVHRECGSTLPGGPSELAPWDKEEKGADSMNAFGASRAPVPLVEPGLRMVIVTSVGGAPVQAPPFGQC